MAPFASVSTSGNLNAKTKKNSYPLPKMQENHGEHGSCPVLLLHGPEEWFLAGEDVGESPPVHRLHWEAWACMSSSVCCMGCATCQPHSRG